MSPQYSIGSIPSFPAKHQSAFGVGVRTPFGRNTTTPWNTARPPRPPSGLRVADFLHRRSVLLGCLKAEGNGLGIDLLAFLG